MQQPVPAERQGEQQREEEHPLHRGHDAVTRDQGPEGPQVGGETHPVDEQQHDAQRRRLGRPRRVGGAEDQQQGAAEAHRHAPGLLERDGLPQEEEGEAHRIDRAQRTQHGRDHGGGPLNGEEKAQLRHEESQEGGQGQPQQVRPGHLLPREEERQRPEECRGAQGPQDKHHHRGNRARIGDVLVEDDVETEDGVGPGRRQMARQFTAFHS